MVNGALQGLMNTRVRVELTPSGDTAQVVGVLQAFDPPWLLLLGNKGAVLCLCVYNVRVIRPAPS